MNPSLTVSSSAAAAGVCEDAPALPRFLVTREYGGWRILDTLLGVRLSGLWDTLEDAEAHLARRFLWWPVLGLEVQP